MESSVNILCDLRDKLGFDPNSIKEGLLRYTPGRSEGGNESNDVPKMDITIWLDPQVELPKWVTQAATRWVLEMWMDERDACSPGELLAVDKKFTHILRNYSMAEIIAFRNTLERNKQFEIKEPWIKT